jgi:hypothetical protein
MACRQLGVLYQELSSAGDIRQLQPCRLLEGGDVQEEALAWRRER